MDVKGNDGAVLRTENGEQSALKCRWEITVVVSVTLRSVLNLEKIWKGSFLNLEKI